MGVPPPESRGIRRPDWERAVPVMAEQALASGSPANNPVVPTSAEIEELYLKIYS